MCLYPTLIKNPKYKPNKKNGGIIPAVNDKRLLYVPIGCQECIECRRQKANNWKVRLLEDIKHNTNGKFITLTFSEESLTQLDNEISEKLKGYDRDNAIATRAIRKFYQRWRKKYKKPPRYWVVTELGKTNTERIHLHGIIWTDTPKDIVQQLWKYGNMGWQKTWQQENNYVSEKSIGYLIKYVTKKDTSHQNYKSIVLTSNGIGKQFTDSLRAKENAYKPTDTNTSYRLENGLKMALPIYYKNKLYTDEQKESLWIEQLNKEERYVNKERVSIKNGLQSYWALLKYNQKLNKEMGFGDGTKNWEQIEYEKQLRELKRQERWKKQTEKHGYPKEWDI